ncbi:hypothetical protein [Spirosoma spitsbergense]|uniref:hypothetical protein n=1 Tax=Spirosoma spitsbergense TaxID=431554 RepID=UPI00036F3065|nr:hypothetical protein [Spirosoma spitsbergense]
MQDELTQNLLLELSTFGALDQSSPAKTVSDAYERILAFVQKLMLGTGHSDAYARAWNLINEDAYKELADFQAGNQTALADW